MHTALADPRLSRLEVLHAGRETFPLGKRIHAVAAARMIEDIRPL